MLAFARTFFACVFALLFVIFVPLFLIVAVALFQDTGPRHDSWLTIGLEGELLEYYGPPTLREIVDSPPPSVTEIAENLEKASVDDRIRGVLFRLGPFYASQGKLDELRAGIRRVQDAGKPVYAYASTLDDGGLYLGSECDSLFLFPKGRVFLLGRGASLEHIKGTLDKLGVEEQFVATGDYKSAIEFYTRTESSPESRENVQWLFDDLTAAWDEVVAGNCGLEPDGPARLRERAILTAAEALAEGIVDATVWPDKLEDRLARPRDTWRTISSQDYAEVTRESVGLGGHATVAVIHGQGFIDYAGPDRWDGMNGLTMGPDRMIADLQDAWEDDDIRAIILRLDTPGGSTDGSLRIARAVARARNEKPVVVSMGDQAASGGYMISYAAHSIVCAENGITGSIGALIGKLNTRGLWEKLGISFDDVAASPNAFLWSGVHSWTPEQLAKVEADNWHTYRDWIEDIARERDMEPEDVDEVARGQVWTGRQARERGLVDATGGFDVALREAKRLADLDEDDPVSLLHWPEPVSAVEVLLSGDFPLVLASDAARVVRETARPRTGPPGAWSVQNLRIR